MTQVVTDVRSKPMSTDTSKSSQCKRILFYLKASKWWISPLAALKLFGCDRLGARIWDLKQKKHGGHKFNERWVTNGEKRWKEFQLKR